MTAKRAKTDETAKVDETKALREELKKTQDALADSIKAGLKQKEAFDEQLATLHGNIRKTKDDNRALSNELLDVKAELSQAKREREEAMRLMQASGEKPKGGDNLEVEALKEAVRKESELHRKTIGRLVDVKMLVEKWVKSGGINYTEAGELLAK